MVSAVCLLTSLGLVAAAGWIKKEIYGDSNTFMKHDVSHDFSPPRLLEILEKCFVEHDNDLLVANLKAATVATPDGDMGVGRRGGEGGGGVHVLRVLARIGERDPSVPPWFQRRLARLLEEEGVDVELEQLKGG
jgi:hypothetical protein